MAALCGFIPPGHQAEKRRFSTFAAPKLAAILNGHGVDTLVITGAQTDMRIIASGMERLDRGCRIFIVEDASSSSDVGRPSLVPT